MKGYCTAHHVQAAFQKEPRALGAQSHMRRSWHRCQPTQDSCHEHTPLADPLLRRSASLLGGLICMLRPLGSLYSNAARITKVHRAERNTHDTVLEQHRSHQVPKYGVRLGAGQCLTTHGYNNGGPTRFNCLIQRGNQELRYPPCHLPAEISGIRVGWFQLQEEAEKPHLTRCTQKRERRVSRRARPRSRLATAS